MKCGFLVLGLSLLTGASCGYRSLNAPAGVPGAVAGLHVALTRTNVPDAVVANEVVFGAREALAKRSSLLSGSGYPCVFIEVLRTDFVAEGTAADHGAPHARGTDIGVSGRAWVVDEAGGEPLRDTGDMRALEVSGMDGDPISEGAHDRNAERRAARSLGEQMAFRILGEPALRDAPLVR